jgi:hypothetical protein
VVDLLASHHRHGRRFRPTGFTETGDRVAVEMTVADPEWGGEVAEGVFKVFTFGGTGDRAVLLQDCTGRDDALGYLAAS